MCRDVVGSPILPLAFSQLQRLVCILPLYNQDRMSNVVEPSPSQGMRNHHQFNHGFQRKNYTLNTPRNGKFDGVGFALTESLFFAMLDFKNSNDSITVLLNLTGVPFPPPRRCWSADAGFVAISSSLMVRSLGENVEIKDEVFFGEVKMMRMIG